MQRDVRTPGAPGDPVREPTTGEVEAAVQEHLSALADGRPVPAHLRARTAAYAASEHQRDRVERILRRR